MRLAARPALGVIGHLPSGNILERQAIGTARSAHETY